MKFCKMIHYYLRNIYKNKDSKGNFQKIIDYLLTFVGDIEVKKDTEEKAIIYYLGTPTVAHLKLEKTGQVTVTISKDDNVTINLINNLAQSLGFRVYNPQINAYLPNDVKIFDLTTIKVDPTIKNVLNQYQLTPLFQYRDTLPRLFGSPRLRPRALRYQAPVERSSRALQHQREGPRVCRRPGVLNTNTGKHHHPASGSPPQLRRGIPLSLQRILAADDPDEHHDDSCDKQ